MGSVESYYDRYWTQGVEGWTVEAPLTDHTRAYLREVVRDRHVLDFGGGNGERYGAAIRSAAAAVTVADVSPAVLEKRRRDGDRAVHVDDLAADPTSFDVALFLEVLEHLLDPLQALRQGAAKVKPGGVVVISVPNAFSWLNRARMLVGRLPASGVGGSGVRGRTYVAPHIRLFDRASVVHLVGEAGLFVEAVQTDALESWRFGRWVKARSLRPVDSRLAQLTAMTLLVSARRP